MAERNIEPGSRWRERDKRMRLRVVVVIEDDYFWVRIRTVRDEAGCEVTWARATRVLRPSFLARFVEAGNG